MFIFWGCYYMHIWMYMFLEIRRVQLFYYSYFYRDYKLWRMDSEHISSEKAHINLSAEKHFIFLNIHYIYLSNIFVPLNSTPLTPRIQWCSLFLLQKWAYQFYHLIAIFNSTKRFLCFHLHSKFHIHSFISRIT